MADMPPSADSAAYLRERRARLAAGTWRPYVDAGPVAAHIARLRQAGLGKRRLSQLSGVSKSTIEAIAAGTVRLVRPQTATKILRLPAAGDPQPTPPAVPLRAPRSICDNHTSYTPGCADCRAANAANQRWHYRQRAYGRHTGRIPADPVREHLRPLVDAGMTASSIAAQTASVAGDCVEDILRGRCREVFARTAAELLAVTLDLPTHALVSSLGTARRLQALARNGWDAASVAERLGGDVRAQQIRRWRRRDYPRIAAFWHYAVADLYRDLGDARGPCPRTAAYAAAQQWVASIHWDDDGDVDTPNARPKQPTTLRRAA